MQLRKRIQKPFKIRYPEGQSKEHYLSFLISKYKKQYPQISEEQIRIPVKEVVGLIGLAIEANETLEGKLTEINFLKRFADEEHFRPEQSVFNTRLYYVSLYCFKEGMKNAPSIALELNDLPFPDEYEKEYLCFTKEMSCEVISGIAQATKDFINTISNKENSNPVSAINKFNSSQKKKVSFLFSEVTTKEKKENSYEASSTSAASRQETVAEPPSPLIGFYPAQSTAHNDST